MISKPINLINAKLEEMYDDAMFWFYATIQAIIFDAINFCYRISQLTQLTSPDRFDHHHHHASLLKIVNKTGSLFRGLGPF